MRRTSGFVPGARFGQGQGRPALVEHPAISCRLRLRRVIIQIDGATQVDPADERALVFIGQRGHLDRLAVGVLVGPGDGFGRRHGIAIIDQVRAVLVLVRVRHRLALERQCVGVAGDRFVREVLVVPAVGAPAEDFPDQQAAARLEHADVAGSVGLPPLAVVNGGLVAVLRFLVGGQPEVGAGHLADVGNVHRLAVVEDQVADRFGRLLRVASRAAAVEDRLDVAVELDVQDALGETNAGLVLAVPLLA